MNVATIMAHWSLVIVKLHVCVPVEVTFLSSSEMPLLLVSWRLVQPDAAVVTEPLSRAQ